MLKNYPLLNAILDSIYRKSPFQKKRLSQFVESQGISYLDRAESFFRTLDGYLTNQGLTTEYAVDSYLQICKDTFLEEMKFKRTGSYSMTNAAEAEAHVYGNRTTMSYYMYGLALSQFLWKNHYAIYGFFMKHIALQPPAHRYLEIGPGHGLFLMAAAGSYKCDQYTAVDLSQASLDITRSMLAYFAPHKGPFLLQKADIFEWENVDHFDFITMGEVLEHVEQPALLMGRIRSLLAEDGRVFISTCANCPAIDHIYQFKTVEEIQSVIRNCGFCIEQEVALSVEDIPMEEWVSGETGVNYAAILKAGR